MFKRFIVLLLFFFHTYCFADWDQWSDTNKKLFVASELSVLADWSTTRKASLNWDACNCHETNPLLGRYPSTDKVDLFEFTFLIANYYIADSLTEKQRNWYLGAVTTVHGFAAANNYAIGLRFNFGF